MLRGGVVPKIWRWIGQNSWREPDFILCTFLRLKIIYGLLFFQMKHLLGIAAWGLLLSLVCCHVWAAAQNNTTDRQKAFEYWQQAISLMDNEQRYDEAILLLQQASALDGHNPAYRYEMAYAYYRQKKYGETIKILKRTVRSSKATADYYRLLGNAYDLLNNINKAEKTYRRGLKKFPNTGSLYAELGGLAYKRGNNDKAIQEWEKGIEYSPTFNSNYYWAATLYCHSSEKLWGLIYGELFMLLEPNGDRNEEMSDLLFSTYGKCIKEATPSTGSGFSASEMAQRYLLLDETERDTLLPFPVLFNLSSEWAMPTPLRNKDIATISAIRQGFASHWFSEQNNRHYPNVLFDWWQKVANAGHSEAYTYWLMRKGAPQEFETWLTYNSKKFHDFLEWFNRNAMAINKKQRFFKMQYAQ